MRDSRQASCRSCDWGVAGVYSIPVPCHIHAEIQQVCSCCFLDQAYLHLHGQVSNLRTCQMQQQCCTHLSVSLSVFLAGCLAVQLSVR